MEVIFNTAIEMPTAILAKFQSLILSNANEYQKQFDEFILKNPYYRDLQFEVIEYVETDVVQYKLKFEPFIDIDYILIKILNYSENRKE